MDYIETIRMLLAPYLDTSLQDQARPAPFGGVSGTNPPGQLPFYQSNQPLTGFLGLLRNKHGDPASWINGVENVGDLSWIIPLLNPAQSQTDIATLLADKALSEQDRSRLYDTAFEWAVAYEKAHPGTFAKYPTIVEAVAQSMSPGLKNLIARPLPEPPDLLPGRTTPQSAPWFYPRLSEERE